MAPKGLSGGLHRKDKNMDLLSLTATDIYWLTRLDPIQDFFDVMLCSGFVAGFFTLVGCFLCGVSDSWHETVGHPDTGDKIKVRTGSANFLLRALKWCGLSILVGGLSLTVIPSTEDIYKMYGIPAGLDATKAVAKSLTENEDAQEIPSEVLRLVNNTLKSMNSLVAPAEETKEK